MGMHMRLSVYLGEAPDSEQAVHGSRALISVHSPQLGKAQGQVPVAVLLVFVNCNVEGAVHGAQLIHLLFYLQPIAACQSVRGMPVLCWRLPQCRTPISHCSLCFDAWH